MSQKFSTQLLDKATADLRRRREQQRLDRLSAAFAALERLSARISFREAYIFGSLTKPHQFRTGSDTDIGFIGLEDKEFFPALAFLLHELGTEVDILQLEGHRLREKVISEGIYWKRQD